MVELETLASKYYNQGYNCSETLFLAINEYLNLGFSKEQARLSSVFGAGMQTGNLCGALAGPAMILGYVLTPDRAHTSEHLRQATVLLNRNFRTECGDTQCAKIRPVFHQPDIRCLNTVLAGARAADKTIQSLREEGILR